MAVEPRALKIGTRLGAEQAQLPAARFGDLQHLADDGFAEALGHHAAVVREEIHQILRHAADLLVAQVVGGDGVVDDGLGHVRSRREGAPGRVQTAACHQFHARSRGGPGMGEGVGRAGEKGLLLCRSLIPAFIGRQRHAHGCGGVGAGALGDHVLQCLRHLLVAAADDEFHLARIDAPVENAHLAGIVPGDVLILQHKGEALIRSVHFVSSIQRLPP